MSSFRFLSLSNFFAFAQTYHHEKLSLVGWGKRKIARFAECALVWQKYHSCRKTFRFSNKSGLLILFFQVLGLEEKRKEKDENYGKFARLIDAAVPFSPFKEAPPLSPSLPPSFRYSELHIWLQKVHQKLPHRSSRKFKLTTRKFFNEIDCIVLFWHYLAIPKVRSPYLRTHGSWGGIVWPFLFLLSFILGTL